jgi:hypothetical protein
MFCRNKSMGADLTEMLSNLTYEKDGTVAATTTTTSATTTGITTTGV